MPPRELRLREARQRALISPGWSNSLSGKHPQYPRRGHGGSGQAEALTDSFLLAQFFPAFLLNERIGSLVAAWNGELLCKRRCGLSGLLAAGVQMSGCSIETDGRALIDTGRRNVGPRRATQSNDARGESDR
jgi:hypothetical protein